MLFHPRDFDTAMKQALIVFAKPPEPGQVKTRLTAQLTPEEAASLYRAFLLDALDQYTALDADVRLYLFAPAGTTLHAAPASVTHHTQQGATLGDRMRHAFAETLDAGYQRAVVIGTDHPTLPSAFIKRAFSELHASPAVVIGPSTDGGYYLLGMNAFFPELFAAMRYSHGDVFADTLDRASRTDARLNILPAWYDVDEPEDLTRLIEDLGANPDQAPRTYAELVRQEVVVSSADRA